MSLAIIVPSQDRQAANEALEQAGFGANNISVPMRGSVRIEPDENGEIDEAEATHWGCHWWADDGVLDVIANLRSTALSTATIAASSGQERDGIDTVSETGSGLFNATVGDSIVLSHKQFGTRWGWRAEMSVRSESFNPGVRAVAIYSDANHRNFLYTTGAFVWDAELKVWATEWNDNRAARADVHWAMLFASAQEQRGTLRAGERSSTLYLRFGLPQLPVDPGEPDVDEFPAWRPWTSGINSDLYQIGARVSHNGRNWVATIGNNHWEPGVVGWREI
jgi:hypothetical protein